MWRNVMVIDLETLRNEIIGNNTFFNTPFGKRIITYADYTASGKTLRFIENYLQKVQECYANTHTIDSFSGESSHNTMKICLTKPISRLKLFTIKKPVVYTPASHLFPLMEGFKLSNIKYQPFLNIIKNVVPLGLVLILISALCLAAIL